MLNRKILKVGKILAIMFGIFLSVVGIMGLGALIKFSIFQDDTFVTSVSPQKEMQYFEGHWIKENDNPTLLGNFILNKDGSAYLEDKEDGMASTWELGQNGAELIINTADGEQKVYTYAITINKIYLNAKDGNSYLYRKDKWFKAWYKENVQAHFNKLETKELIKEVLIFAGVIIALLSPALIMIIILILFIIRKRSRLKVA